MSLVAIVAGLVAIAWGTHAHETGDPMWMAPIISGSICLVIGIWSAARR